jgi:hypothetical protein
LCLLLVVQVQGHEYTFKGPEREDARVWYTVLGQACSMRCGPLPSHHALPSLVVWSVMLTGTGTNSHRITAPPMHAVATTVNTLIPRQIFLLHVLALS